MPLSSLMCEECICLDLRGTNKQAVLEELVDILDRAGKLHDRSAFLQSVVDREATGSTGLQHGVAVPHARSDSVRQSAIAFGVARQGIEFDALDGLPSQFFLMIAEPREVDSQHLEVLAAASRQLIDSDFRSRLLAAHTPAQAMRLFTAVDVEQPSPEPPSHKAKLVVAVTSCPVGISHTYMAAECLRHSARKMGIDIKVETHGAVGVKDRLSTQDIEHADAVILAVDRNISRERFAGRRVVQVGVAEAIRNADALLARALSPQADQVDHPRARAGAGAVAFLAADVYRHLMNGVSSIVPFVVGGGILISLAYQFGVDATEPSSPEYHPVASFLMRFGGEQGAFGLIVPVLAAFVGRSVADRPGLMPAMVGGFVMAQAGAGLIGGMVAGLLGGYGALALNRLLRGWPRQMSATKATLILPLAGLLLSAVIAFVLLGPMVAINQGMVNWLFGLELWHKLLLGSVLGGLMAVDMGGPFNKGAYTFGIIAIEGGNYLPQAAVMAAGMVPPLALGIASMAFPNRFTKDERQSSKTCVLMGATFVTEAAIPYAAADPMRVVPACIIGSATAGALSMAFGCELLVPHGGILVIPLVLHWYLYIAAIVLGTVVAASLIAWLKPRLGEN